MTIVITDVEGNRHEFDSMPQFGIERVMGESDSLPNADRRIMFQCFDDDGELTHTGTLPDDPECENQLAALRFAESDWGATTIKVLRNGEWKQEIA